MVLLTSLPAAFPFVSCSFYKVKFRRMCVANCGLVSARGAFDRWTLREQIVVEDALKEKILVGILYSLGSSGTGF